MLSAIFASLGGAFVDHFFDAALKAFTAYQNKQISMEELKTQLQVALVDAAKEVEVAHAQALANMYASFMGAVEKNPFMQWVWGCVTISQLLVLLWAQIGIPFFTMLMRQTVPDWKYPSAGTTTDWAYLLLAGCIGLGVTTLRNGPGAGNLTDRLKSLVGK
jgi:hypothetical protein